MTLKKALHDAIFAGEAEDSPQPAPPPHPAPPQPVQSTAAPIAALGATSDGGYYGRLKTATDPSFAPALKKVMDLAQPLEAVIPDRTLRMKAAMAQAKAQGIDATSLTNDIAKLKAALTSEQTAFRVEIDQHKNTIASSQSEADELEKKLHNLRTSIAEDKNHLDAAETEFQSAFNRRSSEIEQLASESALWRV